LAEKSSANRRPDGRLKLEQPGAMLRATRDAGRALR
jgi:hypothetical protein